MDVGCLAYKAHKQEGTIVATILVSKVHKHNKIFQFLLIIATLNCTIMIVS